MSATDPLLLAYLATRWRVLDQATDICIGQTDGAVALLDAWAVDTAAIITAWNPASQPLDPAENRRRNARLRGDVVRAGWPLRPCVGTGEDGCPNAWSEGSVAVGGLSWEDALHLGRRYEQNAIVWWTRKEAPAIVVMTEGFAGFHAETRVSRSGPQMSIFAIKVWKPGEKKGGWFARFDPGPGRPPETRAQTAGTPSAAGVDAMLRSMMRRRVPMAPDEPGDHPS